MDSQAEGDRSKQKEEKRESSGDVENESSPYGKMGGAGTVGPIIKPIRSLTGEVDPRNGKGKSLVKGKSKKVNW